MTKEQNDAPAPPAILDLSGLIAVDEIKCEILKDGEPTGWIWTLADTAHPKVVQFRQEQERKATRKQAELEAKRMSGRKIKPEDVENDNQRKDVVAIIAARVLDFPEARLGLPDIIDPVRYSPEMTLRLLDHPKLAWLFNSVVERLNEEKLFTKAEASS
jgi:hypothetical protein